MPLRLQGRVDRPWRFLAIGIVLVIVVLFYVDLRAAQNDTRRLETARDLQQQADVLITAITNAETAQRGYLLTGNPAFLHSYQDAAKQVPGELDQLDRTINSPIHQLTGPVHLSADRKALALIRTLARTKMADLQHAIDVRDQESIDAAVAVVRGDEGRLAMDDLRSTVAVLVRGETLGIYDLENLSQADLRWSHIVVLAGSLVLVLLLFRMGSAVDEVVEEREKLVRDIDDARQLLETTLASIGDAVIVATADGKVQFMNAVAEKLTARTMAEVRDQPLNDAFNIQDETTDKTIDDPFTTLQRRTSEGSAQPLALISKDGIRRPIEDTSAQIRDNTGQVFGLVVVFRDVSGRRAAERDLKRWKEIFSSAGFGMFLADAVSRKILDVNPTFASLHGYSVNELLGLPLQALVPEDSVQNFTDCLQKAADTGRNRFEQPHKRRNGTVFPAFVDVTRFNIGSARYLAGYCSDVSERRRFEDALKESEERFRTLASALPELIWSTDESGHIDYVNQVWIDYAGWPSGESPRRYDPQRPWQDLLHTDDAAHYFSRWRESLDTGQTFETQARLRRASDSTYRWFLIRAVPVHDRDGKIVRWLGGCTDIQQQMQASAQLQSAVEALQRSNSDLEQFAYAASHDLQEPLRMVSIYSQLLQEEYGSQLDEQASQYINFAVNGAHRMARLLKALLAYSRVSAAPDGTPETDATAAANAALLNLESVVSDTHAQIEVGELPKVSISEVHLVQLFQNLIGNALKYRKEGRDAEAPVIRISAAMEESGQWRFAVSDNGVGIEPEYTTQVFGLFKRLHGSSVDGTGIGLALCQKIVERAGGRIWVESEPGRGSTFFFTLRGVETGDHALAYHNFAGRG